MADTPWGEVPESIRVVVDALRANIARNATALEDVDWPRGPHDINEELTGTLQQAEAILQASKDLRSLLTAYAHRFHQPRPTMANVARAQDTSPQAVVSRYSQSTVQAISVLRTFESEAAERRAPAYETPEWISKTDAISRGLPSLARVLAENDAVKVGGTNDDIEGGDLTHADMKDPRYILSWLLIELRAAEVDDL